MTDTIFAFGRFISQSMRSLKTFLALMVSLISYSGFYSINDFKYLFFIDVLLVYMQMKVVSSL